jgi:hypothetical protein
MRRLLLPLLILAGLGSVAAHAAAKTFPGNPAQRLARLPMDPARYDDAKRCLKAPRPGTLALQSWLQAHWMGESWGIMRCEKLGPHNYSLHSEGRALDWHLDAAVPAQKRAAERLIAMLLAPDSTGTPHALARRMGVEELIFNCQYWSTFSAGMGSYSVCRRKGATRTAEHKDHVHIGLTWPGARMQTTFWRHLRET